MAKRLKLRKVHWFSTSPNSRHHTTTERQSARMSKKRKCSKLLHNAESFYVQ